jgi:hypothetical protein
VTGRDHDRADLPAVVLTVTDAHAALMDGGLPGLLA